MYTDQKDMGGFNIQEIYTVVYQFFITYSVLIFPYTICLEMKEGLICVCNLEVHRLFFSLIINRKKERKVPSDK